MTANPPAWSVDNLREMTKAQRLAAVSTWVVGVFEEFTSVDDVVAALVTGPRFVDELSEIARSVARQAAAILADDLDEALRLHEACDRRIQSWDAPV